MKSSIVDIETSDEYLFMRKLDTYSSLQYGPSLTYGFCKFPTIQIGHAVSILQPFNLRARRPEARALQKIKILPFKCHITGASLRRGASPEGQTRRVCGRAQCGAARPRAAKPEALVHLPNCGWTERRRLNTLLYDVLLRVSNHIVIIA